jgi:hypothetical protein
MHRVGVATARADYAERMAEFFPGRFQNIRLFVLDPYDLVLSKCSLSHLCFAEVRMRQRQRIHRCNETRQAHLEKSQALPRILSKEK